MNRAVQFPRSSRLWLMIDHIFGADHIFDSPADIRYLEFVRRGEEAGRIAVLPETERIAAQGIEDERRAQWDRDFANSQGNNPSTMVMTDSQAQALRRFRRIRAIFRR